MGKQSDRCILIPVFDICHIPPLDRVIELANRGDHRIHIAGFISESKDPEDLMEQTIRLTRILKVMLHRLQGRVEVVNSKIYATSKKNQIYKLINDEKVKYIISQKLDKVLLANNKLNREIYLLQLAKQRNFGEVTEALYIHDGKIHNNEEIKEVLNICSGSNEILEKLVASESFAKDTLGESYTEIQSFLKSHTGGCIAFDRKMLKEKSSKEFLDQESSSVLIY